MTAAISVRNVAKHGRACRVWACVAVFGICLLPFHSILLAQNADSALIGTAAPSSLFDVAIKKAAGEMARQPDLPMESLRNATSIAAQLGSSSPGSLSAKKATGVVLVIGGLVSAVGGLAGTLPSYNRMNCSSPRFYDTPDCRRARGLGLGFGIGGIAAFVLGIVLLASSDSASNASVGDPPPQPAAPPLGLGARQAIDEINGQVHGSIAEAQIVGSCNRTSTANLSVRNDTIYPLSLYLAGNASQTSVLNPGATINLSLPGGRYDVGARVSAPNVVPFSGIWNLANGCPYGYGFRIEAR